MKSKTNWSCVVQCFVVFLVIIMQCFVGSRYVLAQSNGTAADQTLSQEEELEEGHVNLEFYEADIITVFKILALKSNVNIVAGPQVKGLVTIQLKNVPWQQALDVIVENYGYAYEKKGSIIVITTVDEMKKRREDALLLADQEPLITETFEINFATAADVINSIEKMKSERGSINFDERTNIIIITDIRRKIQLMGEVIKKLDTTTPQVMIEAKIVETQLTDSDKLGIDWTTQVAFGGAARPTSWPFVATAGKKFMGPVIAPILQETAKEQPIFDPVGYGTLSFQQLKMVFEMLKTRTDTNILSNPKIITLDNRIAEINVGIDTPIPAFGANKETGQLQVVGINWRSIGINFKVTPHINNAGYILLDVEPEISSEATTRDFIGIVVPLVSVERITTSVMVKDGDTLVIAGLIKTNVTDTKKRMPIIADIPVFGLLFRKSEKIITKTDLLIFITPRIVTPDFLQK